MALDLHVAVEEPSPCDVCEGDGIVNVASVIRTQWAPCPGCRCQICGKPTDTPPECGDCALAEDDRWRRAS